MSSKLRSANAGTYPVVGTNFETRVEERIGVDEYAILDVDKNRFFISCIGLRHPDIGYGSDDRATDAAAAHARVYATRFLQRTWLEGDQ